MGIADNLQRVQEQIVKAAQLGGRKPEDIRLVVVTKGHPLGVVKEALSAGVRLLGENYVEEGVEKVLSIPPVQGQVEWHMIGHVQSRKARQVCEYFQWLHSLDSLKLAKRLDRFCGELRRSLPVLLECNVSGEESKYGFSGFEEQKWPELVDRISPILELPNLELRGLMTMAPYSTDPENARPYFHKLRRLRDFLANQFPRSCWQDLSMGMSGDFPVAVQEGSTIVRIGTAILGPRETVKTE